MIARCLDRASSHLGEEIESLSRVSSEPKANRTDGTRWPGNTSPDPARRAERAVEIAEWIEGNEGN
jgi:hypothetical protein